MLKFKISLFLFALTMFIFSCDSSDNYDIIISNGEVYDGSGSKSMITDIGIIGSEIIKIGDLRGLSAKRIINAKGLVVSPGFIDVHTHLDPILKLSNCESHLKQGVTTSLGGPDGSSPWPFGKFLDTLDQIGVGMNIGYLIGHNTIRKNVMSLENRAPTKDEMDIMNMPVNNVISGVASAVGGTVAAAKYLRRKADERAIKKEGEKPDKPGLVKTMKDRTDATNKAIEKMNNT